MITRRGGRNWLPAGAVLAALVLVSMASCADAGPRPAAVGTSAAEAASTSERPAVACTGVSLSLASDRGGQQSPVAAAEWFAGHGGVAWVPAAGWREDARDETGVVVRSGNVTVHAIQGPDQTWQVDSGQQC